MNEVKKKLEKYTSLSTTCFRALTGFVLGCVTMLMISLFVDLNEAPKNMLYGISTVFTLVAFFISAVVWTIPLGVSSDESVLMRYWVSSTRALWAFAVILGMIALLVTVSSISFKWIELFDAVYLTACLCAIFHVSETLVNYIRVRLVITSGATMPKISHVNKNRVLELVHSQHASAVMVSVFVLTIPVALGSLFVDVWTESIIDTAMLVTAFVAPFIISTAVAPGQKKLACLDKNFVSINRVYTFFGLLYLSLGIIQYFMDGQLTALFALIGGGFIVSSLFSARKTK